MKKVLSFVLVLCLLAAALPLSATAEEGGQQDNPQVFILTQDLEHKTRAMGQFRYDPNDADSKVAYVVSTDDARKIASVTWGGVDQGSSVQEDWIAIAKKENDETVWTLTITDQADTTQDFSFSVNVFEEGADLGGAPAEHIVITAHNVNNDGGPQGEEPLFVLCLDDQHEAVINNGQFGYAASRTAYLFTNGSHTFQTVSFSPDQGQENDLVSTSILPDRKNHIAAITIKDNASEEFMVTLQIDYIEQDGTTAQHAQFVFRAFNGQNQPSGGGNPELFLIGIDNNDFGNQWVQWRTTVGESFYANLGYGPMDQLDRGLDEFRIFRFVQSLSSSDESVLKVTGPLGGDGENGPPRWRFEALKAGEVTLNITYVDNAPNGVQPTLTVRVAEPMVKFFADVNGTQSANPDLFSYTADVRTLYVKVNTAAYPGWKIRMHQEGPELGVQDSERVTIAKVDDTTVSLTVKDGVEADFTTGVHIGIEDSDNQEYYSSEDFEVRFSYGEKHLFLVEANWPDFEINWNNPRIIDSAALGDEGSVKVFYGTLAEPGDPLSSVDWYMEASDRDVLRVSAEAETEAGETSPPEIWRYYARSTGPVILTLTNGKDPTVKYQTSLTVGDALFALCTTATYQADKVVPMSDWWYTATSAAYVVSSDPNIRLDQVNPDALRAGAPGQGDQDIELESADFPFEMTPVKNEKNAITAYKITVKAGNTYAQAGEWSADIGFGYYYVQGEDESPEGKQHNGNGMHFNAHRVDPGFYALSEGAEIPKADLSQIHFLLGSEGATAHFVYIAEDGTATAMTPENATLALTVGGQIYSGAEGTDFLTHQGTRYQVLSDSMNIRFFPEASGNSPFLRSSWQFFPGASVTAETEVTLTFTERADSSKVHEITLTFAVPEFYWATDINSSFLENGLTNMSFHYGATKAQKKLYLIPTGNLSLEGLRVWINENVSPEGWVSYQQTTRESDGKSVWEFTILRSRDLIGWVRVEGNCPGQVNGVTINNGLFSGGFGAEHVHEGYDCWEWASNTEQHWQVCKGCGVEQAGSRGAHNTSGEGGACSVCGYKAVTVSTVNNGVVGEQGKGAGSVTVTGGTLSGQTSAVTIRAGGNSVQYDSAALATINSAAGTNAVQLVVEEKAPTASPQTKAVEDAQQKLQQQMAADSNVSQSLVDQMKVMHVSLTTDGTEIEDFNGGRATVTVPFDVFSDVDENDIRVYRVETDGKLTFVASTFNQDGTVSWETPSHSYYMITPKVQADPATPVTPTPAPGSTGGGTEDEEEEPARPFTDVTNKDAWYYDAVYYCFDKGYFAGVSATEFAPKSTMTRAMFATVLYALAGKPEFVADHAFPDVPAGKWYTNSVLWGAAAGIIAGYPDGTFGTFDEVTREQMAVFLWSYSGKPKATADLSDYIDADQISTYAKTAMNWAVSVGIISGKGNGILDPKGKATRAEVAQIVMNYDTTVNTK